MPGSSVTFIHVHAGKMLMCSAPVYNDVVDEWKNAGRPGRRKNKDTKMGELPSYLRGSDSPNKSRKEDLSGVSPSMFQCLSS